MSESTTQCDHKLSTMQSKNHLLISNASDAKDLTWILSKKIKSEHENHLIKKSFLKLPFFEEMLKYFGEDLMGRLFTKAKVETYNSGEYLQKEGSCSNEMFIILLGKVIIKQENITPSNKSAEASGEQMNPYQEEMETQIEKFMNRQDLYRKFIRNRKHQLEENYQKILKKRQELIEEQEKRFKEKEEWEQQKIKWGLVIKHQNRRKFSVYSKREASNSQPDNQNSSSININNNNTQIDLSNHFIIQKYKFDGISPNHRQGLTINYKDDAVQDSLLKVYTENSTKRGRIKKKKEGFQEYVSSSQQRNTVSGGDQGQNSNRIDLFGNKNNESQQEDREKIIKIIEQGDYFGQNSLQEEKIQQYCAIAASSVVQAATISKTLFEEALFSFFEKNLQKEISFLKDISLFSSLKQYELDYIHMQISSKVLEKNAFVYKKGDSSQHLFIILEGEVEIAYVEEEDHSQVISNNISKDILLNQTSPSKKEYPVARLGKCGVFGESELLKQTERRSEVKVLSQKVHLYLLPKEYVNILLEKPEFKKELELQREVKSQYRKKRVDQLKHIEKEGEIRKNQIKYQLLKLKQTGNGEESLQSAKKLIHTGSNILPSLPYNYSVRQGKSQEGKNNNNHISLEDDAFERYLVEQDQPQNNQQQQHHGEHKQNYKSQNNIDSIKIGLNKYNSIDFGDNRLYDFCQPKYGAVSNVLIHPNKLLPKIQISFDQITSNIEKKSYSYRANYGNNLSKERIPQSNQTIDQINLTQRQKSLNSSQQMLNISSSKGLKKEVMGGINKNNRSYSLNKNFQLPITNAQQVQYQQNMQDVNKSMQIQHHPSLTIDYGYDLPFENAFIKRQMQTISQQPSSTINPSLQEQRKSLPIYETVVHNNGKRKSVDKINSPSITQYSQHRNSVEGQKLPKQSQIITEETQDNETVLNYQIPITSSPPPENNNRFDQDDDLSLQGEAYTYLKRVKKIPDRYNQIPYSPPKIDPLRPKDKQIFVRKPMLNKQKKKEINISMERENQPDFSERSTHYQNSVMNMLNYERQKALIQINAENSLAKQIQY